jgi:NAD(P)H-dependent FMN reductase
MKAKPAMIVSYYGGHGGGKCNAQLRQVLGAVSMLLTKKAVELRFPGRIFMIKAAREEQLDLNGASDSGVWSAERKDISAAFEDLTELLPGNASS